MNQLYVYGNNHSTLQFLRNIFYYFHIYNLIPHIVSAQIPAGSASEKSANTRKLFESAHGRTSSRGLCKTFRCP